MQMNCLRLAKNPAAHEGDCFVASFARQTFSEGPSASMNPQLGFMVTPSIYVDSCPLLLRTGDAYEVLYDGADILGVDRRLVGKSHLVDLCLPLRLR